MSTRIHADRLEDLALSLCCSVDRFTASTGSVYLTIARNEVEFKIRVSDHADAHASADYTCDGVEGTATGARAFILARLGITEKTVRRLGKARRSAKQRLTNSRRSEWILGYAKQRGVSIAEAEDACPVSE